jgi:murein DD-endopeptidase MepM/ murein hydrolase activator NlpD
MASVREIVFLGGAGAADDVITRAIRPRDASVDVRVPDRARSGRLQARNSDGAPSTPSPTAISIGEPIPEDDGTGPTTARVVAGTKSSDAFDARVESRIVYYAGETRPTLRLLAKGGASIGVMVGLVRVADGVVVRRWTPDPLEPGVPQSVTWDGKVGSRVPSKSGRYQFQVWMGSGSPSTSTSTGAAPTASAAQAQAPDPEAADTFTFRPYAFPIAGKHAYGEEAALFGAGRDGHTHQGQDVFATCGTPVVAARGGLVKQKDFHGAAGNYVVIDGDGTGQDMAYMHLREAALVETGDRVGTGQVIGSVGDTGHADGCHLHFELWSAPGWYSGGQPLDPLPALRSWEAEG